MKPSVQKMWGNFFLILFISAMSSSLIWAQTEIEPKEETSPQQLGFRFSIKPVVSVADFGRKDFNRDLQSLLGIELPGVAGGGVAQFGLVSSKRWGVGIEMGVVSTSYRQMKFQWKASDPVNFRQLSFQTGLYGEYVFIDRPKFELVGQLGLGLTQGFFHYENASSILSESGQFPKELSLSDYQKIDAFSLKQKILGTASAGLSVRWMATKTFALGFHVRWVQQIGNGYWYGSRRASDAAGATGPRINDLSKSSLLPLEIGIEMIFTSSH